MTTIIARQNENGTVDLGWDSQTTGGGVHQTPKVKLINEQFHVAVGGRARYKDILHYTEVPTLHDSDITTGDYDAQGYLVTKVIPAWISALKESFEDIPRDKEEWPWGICVVVLQGRIFEIGADFAVVEAENGVLGVGTGADYALGALEAGKSIEKALEIAAKLDLYTGGKLHIKKGIK